MGERKIKKPPESGLCSLFATAANLQAVGLPMADQLLSPVFFAPPLQAAPPIHY
jgi:hypothetical protein